MLELYSERLKIRTLQPEDWPLFLSIQQDPQLNQFVRAPDSLEVNRAKFDSRLQPWQFESGEWLTLTIEEISTGQAVGFTGFYASNLALAQVEVGYMLGQDGQGKGYATESLSAVIDWACLAFQVHKFIGVCAQGNKASQRVLEKCGFQLEGVLRHNYKLAQQWVDDCYYGLLAHERSC
ncbi:GNAT family N-acetyltransferase [Shewanella sp. Isolate11]|uniref:GNAT family N-acetyltransferase n=1 Tax=Shewanella sp. Isolate11 TaxID=2908530 RepID=UPI001EFE42B6|nr:GNAT family N-acetyltransferase [Shewanella sp. Isolate11]MCG9696262.1 GNAT family N-acetyltransferase [Shewanella sp. Isolate11]